MIETELSSTETTTGTADRQVPPPTHAAIEGPVRRPSVPKPVRALLALLVLLTVGALVWYFFLRVPPPPPGVLRVTGRLEGDDAAVAAKVAGRIREIGVREGDSVTAGQVVAVLEEDQVRAREEQARFQVEQAEARVARARQQVLVLDEQLEQSRLGIDQARADAEGRVNQARAQVATAQAQLAQTRASYEQARYDAERFATLAREGIEPERTARQTQAVADAQAAAVAAAREQVDAARASLDTARATLANPAIRTAQTASIRQQIVQARSDVDAATADAARARAQLEEARANRSDLTVVAPFDGTVATRTAEPGEVVAAGTPIITLVDLDTVYLRAFVPEGEIGRVKVGQSARAYLDSSPDRPIEARVERVDPEASFTPENTYFRDDRVKQVVGVKLQLAGAVGYAKPGMPAEGEILVEGEAWPTGQGRP